MPKTVEDLMEVTGLGRDLVVSGIDSGQLPGYRVGRRIFCPDEAFEDLIHARWVPRPRIFLVQAKDENEAGEQDVA